MNKLTYLLVLLALSVPFLEGYEYHPSSQEDSSPSDSDGNTFYGRFLRGAHRRLWGPS
ncbi:expressed unknown protein (Partial), partial [Seminavis robusta]|eukprot:Sro2890_g339530.1 n/a (57) ;mRNA; r:2-172